MAQPCFFLCTLISSLSVGKYGVRRIEYSVGASIRSGVEYDHHSHLLRIHSFINLPDPGRAKIGPWLLALGPLLFASDTADQFVAHQE